MEVLRYVHVHHSSDTYVLSAHCALTLATSTASRLILRAGQENVLTCSNLVVYRICEPAAMYVYLCMVVIYALDSAPAPMGMIHSLRDTHTSRSRYVRTHPVAGAHRESIAQFGERVPASGIVN